MPGKTTLAGYGNEHQKLRAHYKKHVVDPGLGYCWRCGKWLNPAEPWELGHADEDRSKYMGPECRKCNRATAGRRRPRSEPRSWVL